MRENGWAMPNLTQEARYLRWADVYPLCFEVEYQILELLWDYDRNRVPGG